MASEMTRAVYGLLSEDKPVTPAGAAYLLRNEFVPQPVVEEISWSLDWLVRNGYVEIRPDQGFGNEYVRKKRE